MFGRPPEPPREVENLIGWRKMKILPVGLLVSPFREGGMTSDLSEEAVCDKDDRHDAPEEKCSPGCGWYAFYDAKEILGTGRWSDPFTSDEAIVEVSAVGKTWLHDKGFRTKQIRMESIWVPKGTDAGLVETLAEMYDLPVYEIPGREEVKEEMFPSDPTTTKRDDLIDQLLDLSRESVVKKRFEGSTFEWKSEKGKSSSPPSQRNEPHGRSPLTSGHKAQQKREQDFLRQLGRNPSALGSPADRAAAEQLLAKTREEISRAMGRCMLCTNPDMHTHNDLDELKGKS